MVSKINYDLLVILVNFLLNISNFCCSFNISISNEVYNKDNVLILLIDDFRHLQAENVNLPNLNFLAENGITFTKAFAQASIVFFCSLISTPMNNNVT